MDFSLNEEQRAWQMKARKQRLKAMKRLPFTDSNLIPDYHQPIIAAPPWLP